MISPADEGASGARGFDLALPWPYHQKVQSGDVAGARMLGAHRRERTVWAAMVLVAAPMLDLAAQQPLGRPDARQRDRMAQGQRLEGQAMLALADAAMAGKRAAAPSDLRIRWQNAFLKAQQGTFVPFTLAIEAAGSPPAAALVYIRAVVKPSASGSTA